MKKTNEEVEEEDRVEDGRPEELRRKLTNLHVSKAKANFSHTVCVCVCV